MVAPLRGTETLRAAQGGKEEVGEGKLRKRRRRGGQDEEYAEKGAIELGRAILMFWSLTPQTSKNPGARH